MIDLEKSSDVFILRGDHLAISFLHVGDRWQHRVGGHDGENWLPILTSEEGAADSAATGGPVLQDLRCEELAGGAVEFQGLGQAGRAFYSAAIRFDSAAQSIDFDLCVRAPGIPGQFAMVSRYLVADGATVQRRADLLVVSRGRVAVAVEPVAIPGNTQGECCLIIDGAVRRIVAGCVEAPEPIACGKGVSVRWRYQMRLPGSP